MRKICIAVQSTGASPGWGRKSPRIDPEAVDGNGQPVIVDVNGSMGCENGDVAGAAKGKYLSRPR